MGQNRSMHKLGAGSGDAWVVAPDGRKFWGTFGAAGLLAYDSSRGTVLLQHRVQWSHFGGTWGLPGGARRHDETPVEGALRESSEEAGVPADALVLHSTSVYDAGIWSYTTVVARVVRPFAERIGDAESIELRWLALDEVASLPLHPGLEASWSILRELAERPPVVIVDAANVVGSRPDGWWRDRRGATQKLVDACARLAETGLPSERLGVPGERCWPELIVVTEGLARGVSAPPAERQPVIARMPVRVVDAEAEGDEAIVTITGERAGASFLPVVVTADRGLRERVQVRGARTRGPAWLWTLLDESSGS